MEYILTTQNLCKQYKHFKALDNVNMHIKKGSIYGFIGKNGAGKTTLIRLICGLQSPTSGEYTLCGMKHTDKKINKARRKMGAVVETPSIYLDMTAEDNIIGQYKVLGCPSFQGVKELLTLVGLENTGNKKVKDFSLGMKQRLGIAVSLAGDPDFLVLDEPVNGLDPQGIIEIRELILKLNREQQITVLISSHILGELSKLATYYGFIDNGHIVKEISAKELEAVCQKCTRIIVTNMNTFTAVLEELSLEYKVISQIETEIYGEINITQLAVKLSERQCEIVSIHEHNESLESYYVNLIGGVDNE